MTKEDKQIHDYIAKKMEDSDKRTKEIDHQMENDKKKLLFGQLLPDSKLKKNYFGIPEPCVTRDNQVSVDLLDMVFVPLVAFDLNGFRIGMGSGYYDRTFEKKLAIKDPKCPVLIGLAYEFQKQECLNHQPWDVPLDMVVTELKTYKFR